MQDEIIITAHSRIQHRNVPTAQQGIIKFYLLGALRIERDGKSIRLPRRKVESLLVYLLLHPEPHTRDQLATLFWGDAADAQARHSLRTALATLRSAIATEFVWADRDHIQVNPHYAYWVDLWALLALGEQMDGNGDQIDSLLRLWHGELFAACYEDWIVLEREYYRTRLLTLFLQLTQTLRARSNYRQAIVVAQQILTFDPANEHAHQHLMFCYMADGDRTAALRQYERCADALQNELDVSPLPETTALYHWIKEQPRAEGTQAARITNLPIPLTSFVGRAKESTALKRLLSYSAGNTRLLTLTGAGGSGKTRLAIQVATDLVDHFPHGVWWVELATVTNGEQLVLAIAKALGICETGHARCRQRLLNFLTTRKLLLVIDNCEHLLAATAQLMADLLGAAPDLQILATSRVGLGVTGEQIWQVPTLPLPEPSTDDTPEELMLYASLRLFAERAAAVQPTFRLTQANAATVSEICRQLDGIPLAIELAAARVKVLGVDAIAAYLNGAIGARFALLTQGSRTGIPRQQTLRATIDWSYALLDERQRLLFRQIAIFHGGFSLDAAAQVTTITRGNKLEVPRFGVPFAGHELLDLLSQLVDHSLVVVESCGGRNRYRLLETLREYALGQFSSEAEKEVIQQRHADYFVHAAERAELDVAGPRQAYWIRAAELELPNLYSALDYLIRFDKGEQALRLADALHHYWDIRGEINAGRQWLQLALTKRSSATLSTQGRTLNAAGWLAYAQSDLAAARPFYEESLQIHRALGDTRRQAAVMQNLALLDMEEGNYRQASVWLTESVAVYRTLAHTYGIARGLRYLGALAWEERRIAEAHAYYLECMAMHQQLGDEVSTAMVYLKLGDVEQAMGNHRAAETNYQRCLEIGQRLQHRWLLGNAYNGLARVALTHKSNTQALRHGEEALRVLRELGDRTPIAIVLATLGAVAQATGDNDAAFGYYGQSLAELQSGGYPLLIASLFDELAALLVASAHGLPMAIQLSSAAESLHTRTGIARNESEKARQKALCQRVAAMLGPANVADWRHQGQATPIDQLIREIQSMTLPSSRRA